MIQIEVCEYSLKLRNFDCQILKSHEYFKK